MPFNSIEFLLFLPTVFTLYWFVFNENLRLQNILNKANPQSLAFNGGFIALKKSNVSFKKTRKTITRHYGDSTFSKMEISYLKKCIKLCVNYKIDCFLVSCPITKEYNSNIPNLFRSKQREFLKEKGFHYLDYSDFFGDQEDENTYFSDGDHLNTKGANIFSDSLAKDINYIINTYPRN
jgi:hypothetical protein